MPCANEGDPRVLTSAKSGGQRSVSPRVGVTLCMAKAGCVVSDFLLRDLIDLAN